MKPGPRKTWDQAEGPVVPIRTIAVPGVAGRAVPVDPAVPAEAGTRLESGVTRSVRVALRRKISLSKYYLPEKRMFISLPEGIFLLNIRQLDPPNAPDGD